MNRIAFTFTTHNSLELSSSVNFMQKSLNGWSHNLNPLFLRILKTSKEHVHVEELGEMVQWLKTIVTLAENLKIPAE